MKTLFLLKSVDPTINIKIFSDDINREGEIVVQDFYKDMGRELTISPTHKLLHDRYIIIDYRSDSEHIFHCGGSSKDMGSKVSTIMEIEKPEVYHPIIDTLMG